MTIDEQVGLRIHSLMFQRKIPQTRLAPALGMGQSALSKKLHGERPWYLEEIYTAARTLGVPVAELLPQLDSNQQPFGSRLGASPRWGTTIAA